MAKQKPLTAEQLSYYSHLLIDRTKRIGLILLLIPFFAATTYVLANLIAGERPWVLCVVPISIMAIPVMVFPMVERWSYKPWQAKTRKYERHYRE